MPMPIHNNEYDIDLTKVKMKVMDCGNIPAIVGEMEEIQKLLKDYL